MATNIAAERKTISSTNGMGTGERPSRYDLNRPCQHDAKRRPRAQQSMASSSTALVPAAEAAGSSKEPKFVDAVVTDPPVDYKKTKDEDIELWAIRIPPGFDASRLDGLTLSAAGARGDGFTVRAQPSCDPKLVVSAFPSSKKNRWVQAKPFTRQLAVIMDPPKFPEVEYDLVKPKVPKLDCKMTLSQPVSSGLPEYSGTPCPVVPAEPAAATPSKKRVRISEEPPVADDDDAEKKKAKKASKKK